MFIVNGVKNHVIVWNFSKVLKGQKSYSFVEIEDEEVYKVLF